MKHILLKSLLLILLIGACRSDEITDTPTDNTPTPTSKIISDVSGLVRSDDNSPLKNVMVRLDDNLTSTDENGYFLFEEVKVNKDGNLITFQDPGFFEGYKFVFPRLNEKAHVEVNLIQRELSGTISAAVGGEVELPSGAKVSLPSQGITTKDGGSYNGDVNVYAHWYNPEDGQLATTMPGDLRGTDAEGKSVQLATFGMMAIELTSPSGQELQIKNGEEATLTFPLSSTLSAQAEDNIPLWSLDEASGVWQEEGQAVKVGNSYVGNVGHFSFWNCDVPFPLVNITGQLTDQNGTPLSNQIIEISMANGPVSGFGWSNDQGYFNGKVPKNEDLIFRTFTYCHINQVFQYEQDIPASSVDIDMGVVVIDVSSQATLLTGTLLECAGIPLQDGYALVEFGGSFEILEPDDMGMISDYVDFCGESEFTIRAFDITNNKYSQPIVVTITGSSTDFGSISICDTSAEYITFTFDGVNTAIFGDPVAYIVDGTNTTIFGEDDVTGNFVDASVPLITEGSAEPSFIEGLGYNSGGGFSNFLCTENGVDYPCQIVTMSITSAGGVGDYVEGGFSGFMYKAEPGGVSEVPFLGQFRVQIEAEIVTRSVSGKVWIDENMDGIRDMAEPVLSDAIIRLARADGGKVNGVNTQANPTIQPDGSYSISGIYPGFEYYLFYVGQYMPTILDGTSDPEFDNDFYSSPVGIITESFLLIDQDINYLDLGVQTSVGLSCFVNVFGCANDGIVLIDVTGGVAPYSYSLNGVPGGNTYDDLPEGTYVIEVTDASGQVCVSTFILESNTRRIHGRVWEDMPGGSPNVYDASDLLLPDVDLILTNSSGFVMIKSDSSGQYEFDGLMQDSYQLTVTVPAGYELVTPQFGNDPTIDSDFDPSTGGSLVTIIIQGCMDEHVLDVGLKKL